MQEKWSIRASKRSRRKKRGGAFRHRTMTLGKFD